MVILAINAYHADVSAVLLRDGELVAAVEEERYRRVKHWAGFPTMAVRACLEIGGISGADVDHVAVSRNPRAHLARKAWFAVRQRPHLTLLNDRLRNRQKIGDVETPLAKALGAPPKKIHYVEHHPAHLASAFLVSPFDEAAVCAVDGFGDFVSTSTARGCGARMEMLDRVFFPHSLGMLYTAVTQWLGFENYGDEYKVMGLAPYGEAAYADAIRRLVKLKARGRFELDLRYFRHAREGVEMEWEEGAPTLGHVYTPELERLLGKARRHDAPIRQRHKDVARSLQAVYEECFFHVLTALAESTESKNLCLAGGCAMNSVANGKIRANTPFEHVYVQPAAGDNGTALGAAFYVWNQLLGGARGFVMDHAYWGPEYGSGGGRDVDGVASKASEETCRKVAGLLADGLVVGWYQGRMEWGARALGNRSILADPRRADMREVINAKIKFREAFRPFAPAILEEAVDEYFVDAAPAPFMQQVYPVRPDRRDRIPAVTHVDGSGRMQTVSKRTNPTFHRLISEFAKLTGVPVLLNTSFNENEPIVNTPEEAFACFKRTQMDALVVGDRIIMRSHLESAHAHTEDADSLQTVQIGTND